MFLVLGANGRTGRHLVRHLREKQKDVVAFVRSDKQAPFFEALGAKVHVGSLDDDFSSAFPNIETVIYAAGSAEDQGEAEERAYDRDAVIRTADLAATWGVARIVVISALMALDENIPAGPLAHYRQMKFEGDEYVRNLGVPYLIIAPAALTDDPAIGSVTVLDQSAEGVPPISREDVVIFTVEALERGLEHRSIGLGGGQVRITEALNELEN